MVIAIDRRAPGAGGAEVKFEVSVRPLDQFHTHGEMTRCDQLAVRQALSECADKVAAVLRVAPQKHPTSEP